MSQGFNHCSVEAGRFVGSDWMVVEVVGCFFGGGEGFVKRMSPVFLGGDQELGFSF